MKIYIEINHFSGDHAHGAFIIFDPNLEPQTVIPFSMPLQSYQAAVEKGLLVHTGLDVLGTLLIESTIFSSPGEFRKA